MMTQTNPLLHQIKAKEERSFWREIQRKNFRSLQELSVFLQLPLDAFASRPKFSLNLPRRLAEKIEKGNLNDPILRQFVPLVEEEVSHLGFVKDPVGDGGFCKGEKLLQKYRSRALLLTSSACAMHCRYCFRQHFPYSSQPLFAEEIKILQEDRSIREVILSGGDPLSLSDEVLAKLLGALEQISHIEIIRFHTRFLVGIPERVDLSFTNLLTQCKKSLIFVLHLNHPKELDKEVCAALKRLRLLGIPLLAQTVLLKGVNDDEETLKELCYALIREGVIPYYLHQLDRVEGAGHFEVKIERGQEMIEALRKEIPGYALFRFVSEIPGSASKTPL